MPARTPASCASGKSTYTMPTRLAASSVGEMLRTVPVTLSPELVRTVTASPTCTRAMSWPEISARHSMRPWRTMRNISVPACGTAPTVAVREEITPSSGAVMRAKPCRVFCNCSMARAACTCAAVALAAVLSWLICCWLKAPVPSMLRARSALDWASCACACAESKLACACSTSASMVSVAKVASTWPFFTSSPTLTFKSAKRKPCVCVLMEMSCQAAMLPLATNSSGTSPFSATTVCTVNAGRAAVLSAASVLGEHAVTRLPPKARAMARAMSERYWSFFMVFCWRCVAIYLMAAWGRFG